MTTNQIHDDASIDALARRAGAEVRQPAPAGIITAVRRARRRQQVTRGVIGVTGTLVAVAALVLANKQTQPNLNVIDPATPIVNPTAAPPPGSTIVAAPRDSTVPGDPTTVATPGSAIAPPSSDLATELANFQVASLAFADPLNGWQLSVVDGTGIVRRTVDGGVSWQSAGTVPGPIESTSSLSFSTTRDGYLINKPRFVTAEATSTLFVTHDAGATWQPSQTPGSVMQIIGGPEEDLAMASQCTDSGTGACPVGLLASSDHGDTWTIRSTSRPLHPASPLYASGAHCSSPAPAETRSPSLARTTTARPGRPSTRPAPTPSTRCWTPTTATHCGWPAPAKPPRAASPSSWPDRPMAGTAGP